MQYLLDHLGAAEQAVNMTFNILSDVANVLVNTAVTVSRDGATLAFI